MSGHGAGPRRFSPERLGRILEITSKVQCECPNHVAKLVEALGSFEDYSRGCENRNEADRAVHAMLADASGRARVIMEEALEALLRAEGIVV